MKILIITYLNCLSPGTFLQAYGVQKGLKKEFPDADICFLNSRNVEKSANNIKISIKKIDFAKQKVFAVVRLLQLFFLQKKHFKVVGKKIDLFNFNQPEITQLINQFDLLVIGSDTILENVVGTNENQIGIMWPDDQIKIKKVYFAASAAPGNFTLDDKVKSILKERINEFAFIGLRDDITMTIFKNILGDSNALIVKQPDPTYFVDLSEFKLPFYYRYKLNKKRKYCLFTFNSQFQYRRELSEILKENGFTLISAQYIPEADICLATLNPLQWGSIFKYCDLIVTERFHDTVFALRNCKPVFSLDWDETRFSSTSESKTKAILKEYSLEKYHMIIHDENDLHKVRDLLRNITSFDSQLVNKMNERHISLANTVLGQIGEKTIDVIS